MNSNLITSPQTITIKYLCEFIWKLEQKYDLIDWEIDGIKIWQCLRLDFYYMLAEKLDLFEYPYHKRRILFNVKYLFRNFNNIIIKNPIISNSKPETIIIEHQRLNNINGNNLDIYTHYLIEKLKARNNDKYEIYYRSYEHERNLISKNQKCIDIFLILSKLKAKLFPKNLAIIHQQKIDQINKITSKVLNLKINITDFLKYKLSYNEFAYALYKQLLRKKTPRKIFLTVSYGYSALIKAAKELQIEVIELQHGVISKYHMGYSYPSYDQPLDYFPDKFYCWGKYWKEIKVIPLNPEKILISGFHHLIESKSKRLALDNKKNKIIILSQGALSKKISKLILDNYPRLKEFSIKYKLHPFEFARWKKNKYLLELSKYNNLEVVKHADLYSLFAESEFQIGVSSTTIYEGLAFGCKTLILNLPGAEYMEDLIKGGHAVLVNNNNLVEKLNQYKGINHNDYWKEFFKKS